VLAVLLVDVGACVKVFRWVLVLVEKFCVNGAAWCCCKQSVAEVAAAAEVAAV
jgi:hypothetical protein